MTRAQLKAKAKEQLKGKVGMFFLCLLIMIGISMACGAIPVVGWIASIFVTPALSLGLIKLYLHVTKGEEVEVGKLFDGFKSTGKATWLNILIGFFTYLWSLLFVIPGIVKSYAYSMAFYILAENSDMTAREALRKSKEITKGHKWDLFVLELSFIPWILLVTITCGIAAIYVVPYMDLTIANFYNEIKEKPQTVIE